MRTGGPFKEVATEEQGKVDDAWIGWEENHQGGLRRELKKWRQKILTTLSRVFFVKGSREIGLPLERGARSGENLSI